VQILVLYNNHEFDVGKNCSVRLLILKTKIVNKACEMQICCYSNVKYSTGIEISFLPIFFFKC
jgi:hypothetical protein